MYKQGDIVVIRYPFSDAPTAEKLRPALIVSNATSNQLDRDFLVCPITSTIRDTPFSYILTGADSVTNLPKKSEIRCNKIVTVRDKLISDKFSELHQQVLPHVIQKVKS